MPRTGKDEPIKAESVKSFDLNSDSIRLTGHLAELAGQRIVQFEPDKVGNLFAAICNDGQADFDSEMTGRPPLTNYPLTVNEFSARNYRGTFFDSINRWRFEYIPWSAINMAALLHRTHMLEALVGLHPEYFEAADDTFNNLLQKMQYINTHDVVITDDELGNERTGPEHRPNTLFTMYSRDSQGQNFLMATNRTDMLYAKFNLLLAAFSQLPFPPRLTAFDKQCVQEVIEDRIAKATPEDLKALAELIEKPLVKQIRTNIFKTIWNTMRMLFGGEPPVSSTYVSLRDTLGKRAAALSVDLESEMKLVQQQTTSAHATAAGQAKAKPETHHKPHARR